MIRTVNIPTITIPDKASKSWSQTNSGDVFGNLFSSKNISFDREGYLSLAPKVRAFYRESSTSDLDQILAIVFSPVGDLVVTSDECFEMDLSDTNSAPLVVNADAGVQDATSNGDALAWNGRIYQTGATATKYWDGNTWSSASITLVSGVPHPMAVFESLNYLAVTTDKNIVKLYDTSHTLITTLTIPAENQIQWLVYRDSNLYIGTKSLVGRNGRMYVWNGSSSAAQKAWDAKGEALMAGCEYGNSIATISSIGQVLLFNGGGFTELANLPVYYTNYKWTGSAQRVARRGMIADGDILYINIEGQVVQNNSTTFLPNQPSGLWCYDPKVGLYHKGAFSTDYVTYATMTAVDLTTNTFTLGTAVETQTGEPVFYDAVTSSFGGLTNNRTYYAIRVDSTHFKLAKNYDDAIAGTAIDITSDNGTFTAKLSCPKGSDFGATYNSSFVAGAVALIPESRTYYDFFTTRILYGGYRIPEDAVATTYSMLQSFAQGENRGNFVTQKIFSNNIEDVWNKIVLKARNIYNTNDKIVVKYRTEEKQFFPVTPDSFQLVDYNITWTSTTSFTVTDTKWAYVEAGDEVEVIAGAGAGYTAHISTITESSGTYTVTIDETLPLITANDTAQVVVNNWTKGATITSTDTKLHKTTPVNAPSKWIQIKCELRGEGTQVEELQVVNKTHLPTV